MTPEAEEQGLTEASPGPEPRPRPVPSSLDRICMASAKLTRRSPGHVVAGEVTRRGPWGGLAPTWNGAWLSVSQEEKRSRPEP